MNPDEPRSISSSEYATANTASAYLQILEGSSRDPRGWLRGDDGLGVLTSNTLAQSAYPGKWIRQQGPKPIENYMRSTI
jgi:hypothetical protein